MQGAGGGGQCRVAGAAADARAVSEPAGADSAEPVFALRSAAAWQTSIAQGHSPTGWAGRAADYIASQNINSSNFPTFFSVAGNALEGTGVTTQPVALAPGAIAAARRDSTAAASQARLSALNSLLTIESGVSLVQAANDTLSNSISDATALAAALAKATPLKTQFPTTSIGAQLQQVAQIIQVQSVSRDAAADFLLLAGRIRYARRRARDAQHAVSRN